MSKVWIITGTSKGLGRAWAEAALERGDRVAATARDASTLDDLVDRYGENVLPLQLDVTDKASIDAAVATAHSRFGRLDVVVNNAGYALFGAIEEVTVAQARAQFDTNFFGALCVTQAALPLLRAQSSGHIIQVSSIGGAVSFPLNGLYCSSKWALEGLSEALAGEVAQFGVKVTIVEPWSYVTDSTTASAVLAAAPNPVYAQDRQAMAKAVSDSVATAADPRATGAAILRLVDADEPPLRAIFGTGGFDVVRSQIEGRLATWEAGEELAQFADGTGQETRS
jgi:NAD(P)-dependent dehydrogenase (short-subunit alcohol dehydrogenase family)